MFFNSKSIANNQKNSTEVNIKKLVKNRFWHEYTKDLFQAHTRKNSTKTNH